GREPDFFDLVVVIGIAFEIADLVADLYHGTFPFRVSLHGLRHGRPRREFPQTPYQATSAPSPRRCAEAGTKPRINAPAPRHAARDNALQKNCNPAPAQLARGNIRWRRRAPRRSGARSRDRGRCRWLGGAEKIEDLQIRRNADAGIGDL